MGLCNNSYNLCKHLTTLIAYFHLISKSPSIISQLDGRILNLIIYVYQNICLQLIDTFIVSVSPKCVFKSFFFFHEKKRYSKHRLTENSMAIYQCRYLNLLKLITFCKSVFLPSVIKTVPATNTALISTLGHQITYFQQGCIDTHFGLPKISST